MTPTLREILFHMIECSYRDDIDEKKELDKAESSIRAYFLGKLPNVDNVYPFSPPMDSFELGRRCGYAKAIDDIKKELES